MNDDIPRQELIQLSKIEGMLARATNIEEILDVRSLAEMMRGSVSAAKLGLEAYNRAAEVKLRAEREVGKVLLKLLSHGGDQKSALTQVPVLLNEFNISRNASSLWQRYTRVSDEDFSQFIKTTNAMGEEVSSKGLLRLLAKRQVEKVQNGQLHRKVAKKKSVSSTESSELCQDLFGHLDALESLLESAISGETTKLTLSESKAVARYLREVREICKELWKRQ